MISAYCKDKPIPLLTFPLKGEELLFDALRLYIATTTLGATEQMTFGKINFDGYSRTWWVTSTPAESSLA